MTLESIAASPDQPNSRDVDEPTHGRRRQRRYDARLNLPMRRHVLEALDRAAQSEDVSPCVVARRGILAELRRMDMIP